MRHRTRVFSILIAIAAAAYLACPASAYIYAGKRKKVNCGVLLVQGAGQTGLLDAGLDARGLPVGSGVGDLFYVLDQRIDLKPAGWSLDNPLSPGSPSSGFPKSDPRYWIVDLAAVRSLSRMHVLYLPAQGDVNLNEQDREKLRQFVDGGGVLWIDNAGTGGTCVDFEDTFFILDFLFESATGADVPFSRHHPLLSLPFWLTDADVSLLGSNYGRSVCKPGYDPNAGGWGSKQPVNFDVLYPVVMNMPASGSLKGLPSVAANHYGSGRIVATANYAGRGCYLNYPYNTASLKFAYNVIAWASSWTHLRKDPRHSGNSIDTVGGTKLLETWTLPVPPSDAVESAPIIYKNIAFYTSGSTVFALDIMPDEDLDQNGNPDDGAQGLPGGMPDMGQDIIWMWNEPDGAQLSAPSLVTAQHPLNPSASIEAVLVMSARGIVYMLEAFPSSGPELLDVTSSILPGTNGGWAAGTGLSNPSPPLYANGWIFAMCGEGRMNAYNPSLEAWKSENPDAPGLVEWEWHVPGTVYAGSADPRCGPSFGFVKNENSGATVGMLYWFGGPWNSGQTVQDQEKNDHTYGVPIYVSNDRLRVERTDQTGTLVECRTNFRDANMSENPAPLVQVQSNGAAVNVTAVYPNTRLQSMADPGNDRGYVVIQVAGSLAPDALVYATYAMDYAKHKVNYEPNTKLRVPLEPRSNDSNLVPQTKVAGMPAMGPNSLIFLNGDRESSAAGGSVYALENDGSSQYTRWHYLMHSGLDPAALAGTSGVDVPVPGVFFDSNGFTMSAPRAFSSPAVVGGKVFVTVTGSGGNGPGAALACFKAESDFVVRVTENAGFDGQGRQNKKAKRLINESTGREMQVKVWQPNLLGPTQGNVLVTPLISAVPVPRDMIDHERGVITFSNFDRLKLRGGVGNVMMTGTFSPSLPVWVFVDNVEVPIDFNTWQPTVRMSGILGTPVPTAENVSVDLSGWNNLLWYYIVPPHSEGGSQQPCSGIHSSPVVIGNTVYFVCDDGYLFALPAEVSENSGGPIKDEEVTWTAEVSSTGGNKAITSVAGSNGVLLVPAADGLHAFSNATTLVADSNRLVEVDGAGEAVWAVDSITWPTATPQNLNAAPALTSGPINKPSRVRYLTGNELLLVNSGANQVCKIDKSGAVGIARTRVQIGGNAQPDGYTRWMWGKFVDPGNLLRPGQPTELRGPTDALYWQEFEAPHMVYHCLVADSGNHRVLDLVYRVRLDNNGNPQYLDARAPADPATGFYLPELNWVSVTNSLNERYVYESIQLVPNYSNGTLVNQEIWAAVSNYRTDISSGAALTRGLGGAIVALAYRKPRTNGGWYYGDPANNPKAGQIVAACDRVNWGGERPLASPRYFQVMDRKQGSVLANGGRSLLICDNYGVYEVGPLGDGVPGFIRGITDEMYRTMPRTITSESTGKLLSACGALGNPLVATSVQELPNGNWLVANSYAGADEYGKRIFAGELFEHTWSPGPNESPIQWCAPTLYTLAKTCGDILIPGSTPPKIQPDAWRQKMQKSYVFQQPRCAFRQF